MLHKALHVSGDFGYPAPGWPGLREPCQGLAPGPQQPLSLPASPEAAAGSVPSPRSGPHCPPARLCLPQTPGQVAGPAGPTCSHTSVQETKSQWQTTDAGSRTEHPFSPFRSHRARHGGPSPPGPPTLGYPPPRASAGQTACPGGLARDKGLGCAQDRCVSDGERGLPDHRGPEQARGTLRAER